MLDALVLPYGDRAVLVELPDTSGVAAYAAAVRAARLAGVVDVVPAARTVLVVVDPARLSPGGLRSALAELRVAPAVEATDAAIVTIDVRYDGPDLAEVAMRTGRTEAEVVLRHSARTYRSAFCGFAPGFAYLTGLDPVLHLPRRDSPRPRVPRGSVAIAAEFCGVYPNDMPGGWHLLGTTDATLFDLGRDEPALLASGTSVRFRPV